MKKYFSLVTAVIMAELSLTLVSCGDDDDAYEDGTPKALTGTWRLTFVEDGYNGWMEFQFKSDGTFVYRDWAEDDNTIYSEYGKYYVEGNNITLEWDDGTEDTFVYSINGKKLMFVCIEGDTWDKGDAWTMIKQ